MYTYARDLYLYLENRGGLTLGLEVGGFNNGNRKRDKYGKYLRTAGGVRVPVHLRKDVSDHNLDF
jgi:hypothetical protein